MGKVEEVARAMHDADWRQQEGLTPAGQPRSWDNNPEQAWWLTLARAAITALREPSQAQHQAFAKTLDWMSDTPLGDQQREAWKEENVRRWHLMIDSALKSG